MKVTRVFALFLLFLSFCTMPIVLAHAGVEEGLAAIDAEDYDLAFFEMSKAAKRNDIEAKYYLGMFYLSGKGTEQDEKMARTLFLESAEGGYVPAQYQLGVFLIEHPHKYDDAVGKKQTRVALYWLRRAGKAEYLDAQLLLADMYERGDKVEQSYMHAYAWLKRASRQYKPGEERNEILGRLVTMGEKMSPEDIEKAREISIESAEETLE